MDIYVKCGRVAEYSCLFFFYSDDDLHYWTIIYRTVLRYGAFGTVLELVIWIRIRIRISN